MLLHFRESSALNGKDVWSSEMYYAVDCEASTYLITDVALNELPMASGNVLKNGVSSHIRDRHASPSSGEAAVIRFMCGTK